MTTLIVVLAIVAGAAMLAAAAWLMNRDDDRDPFAQATLHVHADTVMDMTPPAELAYLTAPPVAEPQVSAGITPFPSRERLDGPAATTRTSPAAPLPPPGYTLGASLHPGTAAVADATPPAPPPLPTPWLGANHPDQVPFKEWDPTTPGSDDWVQAVTDLKAGAS